MIRIARKRKLGPRLIQPAAAWFTLAKNSTAAAKRELAQHEFAKSVYAADAVKAALEELFFHKCAYCETPITPGFDWDVEHYRPKGKVAEAADHPGYYWLAYTWTNLYPSCQHCNQNRKDRPLFDDPAVGAAAGKLDQFPLTDEATRAKAPRASLKRERRLLLDPCSDDPSVHLTFGVDGAAVAVGGSAMGFATIRVFNLNRRRLKMARRKVISRAVKLLKVAVDLERAGHAVAAQQLRELFLDELASPSCDYSAAAATVSADPNAFGIV